MLIRWRTIGMACAAVGAGWCLALAPATAAADTTPGAQTVGWSPASSSGGVQQAQCQPPGGPVGFGWAQLASQNGLYTVPSDGVITSWTFTTGADAAQGLYLVVYRGGPAPTANYDNAGSYTPVAWSPAFGNQASALATDPSQVADSTVSYPARITVKAGDVLGVAGSCVDWYPSPSPTSGDFPFRVSFNAPPAFSALGQPTTTIPYGPVVEQTLQEQGFTRATWPGYRLPVSAQLEPDADGDGFGDLTQDLCPGAPGSVDGCPKADLGLTEAVPATSPGPDMPFTLTATNHGPDPVPDAVVTDPVPSGTTVKSVSTTSGTCTGSTTLTCQLGALAAGQSATITVVLQGTVAGAVTNSAGISSQTLTTAAANAPGAGDPNAANNIASATTTLQMAAAPGGTSQTVSANPGSTPTGTSQTAPANPGGTNHVPVLTGLRESSANWRESRTNKSKLPVGDTFKFTLTTPAAVTVNFAAQAPGRRVHGTCVAPARGNIGRPHCTRTVASGRLSVAGKRGPNGITFKGRVAGGKLLAPGTYVITLVPRNTTGLVGASHKLTFTIAA